ncbi:MAG TPA: hypothetical protein VNE58_07630 [Casimicrobiaceae bacterium]|nr:hypothetical protein [Casimicrobiaceae bacterium]
MKKSLIALAAAGVLFSGAAAADRFAVHIYDNGTRASSIAVNDDDDFRRGYGRGYGHRLTVDERQARINTRIRWGFDNGHLSRREARSLGRELAAIEDKERAYEADGRLGPREQADLHRDLDRLSQRLRFEARDDNNRRY